MTPPPPDLDALLERAKRLLMELDDSDAQWQNQIAIIGALCIRLIADECGASLADVAYATVGLAGTIGRAPENERGRA